MTEEAPQPGNTSANAEVACDLRFAAAGSNRNTGCLAALPRRELVAYGAAGNVVILERAGRAVAAALPCHREPVTGITLTDTGDSVYVVAASASGKLTAWVTHPPTSATSAWTSSNWRRAFDCDAHKGAVVAVDAAWNETRGVLVIATVGLDAFVRLGSYSPEGSIELETRCDMTTCSGGLARALPECVALCHDLDVPGTLLAIGGTDERLHLFCAEEKNPILKHVCALRGHRDWVRGVKFSALLPDGIRYVATASKDWSARLWTLRVLPEVSSEDIEEDDLGPPSSVFDFAGLRWELRAAALLREHGKAVQSVCFETCSTEHVPRLATASMDCTIAVWSLEDDAWSCVSRFGLLGGAGAHALGFFGAVFATCGVNEIIGNNFGGALHCWRASQIESEDLAEVHYIAHPIPSGHFAPVSDLDWHPNGDYLISCSHDKTVRVFLRLGEAAAEAARPQTHGHALHAVGVTTTDGLRYVSAAEETMLRVFEAPTTFLQSSGFLGYASNDNAPAAAALPALGLSNKAVYSETKDANEVTSFGAGRAQTALPLEEDLKQHTLWPEVAKLYGHGNPISCVAVCLKHGILASASLAQNAKDAGILLWNIANGKQTQHLEAHELTVTRLLFSEDGNTLLSLSRDRSFALHRRLERNGHFETVYRQKDAHGRMVFDGAWLFGSDAVVTCGRDKKVRFFATRELFDGTRKEFAVIDSIKYAAVPCAVATKEVEPNLTLASVGFEDGNVRILHSSRNDAKEIIVRDIGQVPTSVRCSSRITRLRWKPNCDDGELAIASEDCSVRVLRYNTSR